MYIFLSVKCIYIYVALTWGVCDVEYMSVHQWPKYTKTKWQAWQLFTKHTPRGPKKLGISSTASRQLSIWSWRKLECHSAGPKSWKQELRVKSPSVMGEVWQYVGVKEEIGGQIGLWSPWKWPPACLQMASGIGVLANVQHWLPAAHGGLDRGLPHR